MIEKEVKVIGGVSRLGIWGKQFRQQYRVIDKKPNLLRPERLPCYCFNGAKMEKEIKIIGGIGNTARQNRDTSRVLGGGVQPSRSKLTAHKSRRMY